LLRSLRTFPLLDGYRGSPRLDTAAVEDVLLRVSAMVDRHPEIAELDLNPLIVSAAGVRVADARIRVQQPLPERPLGAL
ncbi:MAG: acetate--CoA ligase family protein, partial [Acidobacteriota bacterium]|nr:acetate--CoA ligase family protein [Acidobacteriota bacterium]